MDSSPLMKEFVTGPAKALWIAQGLPPDTLDNLHLSITPDPAVNSSFKLGTAAQTSIGLSALAATHFHKLRTTEEQTVTIDARHAVIEFNSEKYYTIDGKLPKDQMWDELSDMYKTKDGYVRLHTNFSHHKQGILDILGCASTKSAVAAALLGWGSFEFEDEVRRRNLCAVALRTFGDTDRNAHSRTIINTQPVHIRKIGDALPRPNPKGAEYKHALEGIRVLDLTRVLGGPVGGRTLAAHGADVLLVTSPHLPDLPFLDVETSRGKRTTQLDLNNEIDKSTLWNLVRDADVFLQSYRPGGLAARGFGPEEVARQRPGIVYATLTAFGFEGELSGLKGFDSLMQAYSGMNAEEADAYREYVQATGGDTSALPPYRATPMQALDHAAGYLLAYGIITALSKTITEGGSWEVNVSLASTMYWLRSLQGLGAVEAFREGKPIPSRDLPWSPELEALTMEIEEAVPDGAKGPPRRMRVVRHAATLSGTPVKEGKAPMRLDADRPEWLPRASR